MNQEQNLTIAEINDLYQNNREEYDRRFKSDNKKDFNKMTLAEQTALYQENKEEYDKHHQANQLVKCFKDLKVAEQMALYEADKDLYDYYSKNPNAPMSQLEEQIMGAEQKKADQVAYDKLDNQAKWAIKMAQDRAELNVMLKELEIMKIELEQMKGNK